MVSTHSAERFSRRPIAPEAVNQRTIYPKARNTLKVNRYSATDRATLSMIVSGSRNPLATTKESITSGEKESKPVAQRQYKANGTLVLPIRFEMSVLK